MECISNKSLDLSFGISSRTSVDTLPEIPEKSMLRKATSGSDISLINLSSIGSVQRRYSIGHDIYGFIKHSIDSMNRLVDYEHYFRQIESHFKDLLNDLDNRKRKAIETLRLKPKEIIDLKSVHSVIEEVERAEELLKKTNLSFVESSILDEMEYCFNIEFQNSKRREDINTSKETIEETLKSFGSSSFLNYDLSLPEYEFVDNQIISQRINDILGRINERRRDIRQKKRDIKRVECAYEEQKRLFGEKLKTKDERIKELEDQIIDIKRTKELIEEFIKKNDEAKDKFFNLKLEVEQYDRQRFTVTRDKENQKRYIKHVNNLNKTLEIKQAQIETAEMNLQNKRNSIKSIKREIEEQENKLEKDEQRISLLEKTVQEIQDKFEGRVDESKKELSYILNSHKSMDPIPRPRTLGDELSSILFE